MEFPPSWRVMWGSAFVIYALCKYATWRAGNYPVSPRSLGYLLAWPGLNLKEFMDSEGPIDWPTPGELVFAASKTLLGSWILAYGMWQVPESCWYLRGWVGMSGFVFALHFGVFHLISCAWRSRGVRAEPLMAWPILSRNLSEFWGRRWNRAFRDFANQFLFRPLVRRWGVRKALVPATVLTFAASGLVHELVISVPARGGYGGPTLYFLIQGAAVLAESRLLRGWGFRGGWGRLYAVFTVLAPSGLLFPPPFVRRVALPFFEVFRSLACLP